MNFFKNLFSGANQKEVSKYNPLVEKVVSFEDELVAKTDAQLKKISLDLKAEITGAVDQVWLDTASILDKKEQNRERKKRINAILGKHIAYAFALVREASKRSIGLRHFDVQIIGGAVLNEGQIAEMKTGEGKTLVASLALYLNALTGKGAQLVTVNDYLARRDAGWMARIYNFLGLTTGVIGGGFSYVYDPEHENDEEDWRLKHFKGVTRQQAYQADITYGTNNEFGFDYLRDNMAQEVGQLSQRELVYAIVDEVDSILIDEARTPLIISSPSDQSADYYAKFAAIIPRLKKDEDYAVDEKAKSVSLRDSGIHKIERAMGIGNLYDPANSHQVHYAEQSLKAYALFKKNRDYIVKDGEVIIVDEFTGRMLQGRRYSGGLHQAIEAKEKQPIKEESVTLATITFQNLFRIYTKLAGMTGTASTEAEELSKIYSLEVVAIPTNRANQRIDRQDLVYRNETGKFKAIVDKVRELQEIGQPVLIGTVSIAKSETLAKLFKANGIKHNVLNAKFHQKEAEVIAQAGQIGAVTVATNMAGRGVDIVLGGAEPTDKSDKEAVKAWEASHEKVLELGGLCVIGTERHESRRIDNQLRGRSGRQGDPGVSLFFVSMDDDLMRIFGGDRMKNLMETLKVPEDMAINNVLLSRAIEQAQSKVETHNFEIRKQLVDYDDVMNKHREAIYRRRDGILRASTQEQFDAIHQNILEIMGDDSAKYLDKWNTWPEDLRYKLEKLVSLRAIDILWVDHLRTMENLRESIGLRGYAQKEPLVEYKQEAYHLFNELQELVSQEIKNMLLNLEINPEQMQKEVEKPDKNTPQAKALAEAETNEETPSKIGRNDLCPCGSGKKYKKCHGK